MGEHRFNPVASGAVLRAKGRRSGCNHDRSRPIPEVGRDGLLTGRCHSICAKCKAVVFDNRKRS